MSFLTGRIGSYLRQYGNYTEYLASYHILKISRHKLNIAEQMAYHYRDNWNRPYKTTVQQNYSARNNVILCGVLSFFGFSKKDEDEEESELIITIKRGILLMQKGEFKKSEQMLHLALKLAQEQQNMQAVTYIYDIMANRAFEAGEVEKAEKLFVNVLQHLMSSGVPANDNKIIHISLKLARIYQEKSEIRKAEEGFKFCTENLQKKVHEGATDEDTLILWAMSLDWYARFVLDQGRYKEAFNFFKKAYDMSLQFNDVGKEQTVVLLNDLGTVCCLQEDYDSAIKYLTEAVSVGKSLPEMEDFASIYVNLGTVFLKKMMFEEAKRACESAWKTAKLHNNQEALNEANVCLNELKAKASAQHKN